MSNEDAAPVAIEEHVVLSKFNGDSTHPNDEFERMEIHNGKILAIHQIENGKIVKTTIPGEDS